MLIPEQLPSRASACLYGETFKFLSSCCVR